MKKPTKEQLLQDILSDATWTEIAEKYGYSDPRFLRKLSARYGLPKRRTILKPSEAELRKMILVDRLQPHEIAQKLGYGSGGWSNIYAYCRKYGIEVDFPKNYLLHDIPFSQEQKDVALGSLLGDAYLRPSGKSKKSFALSFAHGEKQLDYLKWKLGVFSAFVSTKELYRRESSFRGNAPCYSFSTISHPYLAALHKLCYPNGKKGISQQWLDLLSPQALAVWYLDDGSLNRRYGTVVLCTNCFSRAEQDLIIRYLHERWGIEAKLEPRRNNQFVIRINASQSKAFRSIIAPYVPECMSYKLG